MTRRTIESCQRIDIRALRRTGRLPDHASMLRFSIDDGSETTIHLKHRTAGQRAGTRMYFRCPRCWRTCELLYVGRAGLACRCCWRLRYHSENLSKVSRNTERLYRLRRRLGQEPNGAFDDWPEKPKGMHWSTYDRKIEQLEKLEARANGLFCQSVAGLLARFALTP